MNYLLTMWEGVHHMHILGNILVLFCVEAIAIIPQIALNLYYH